MGANRTFPTLSHAWAGLGCLRYPLTSLGWQTLPRYFHLPFLPAALSWRDSPHPPQANKSTGDAQSRYYALAHSIEEKILSKPNLLLPPAGGALRDYQMLGLSWMVSLYNNHLNGILADEMGLGKTVQVMALIAYLMEFKGNYGPHLIIVPNAVLVNWKAELQSWLPSVKCVYYVGHKDERARLFTQSVAPMQFNVLVTTYEFIMRDRSKLSKVEWKYIIIDEAQRMKDRSSKLAKDLDRYKAARRLLLTGTPLQNDLAELWSLLNLLLPEVFDDNKGFTEWFSDSIASGGESAEDDWLQKEKRVVVIHRLHQILEPFMLRRQVGLQPCVCILLPAGLLILCTSTVAFPRAGPVVCGSWLHRTVTH